MKIKEIYLILASVLMLSISAGAQMPEKLIPGGNTIGIRAGTKGLLVTAVEEDSPAERAGLRRGDVLLNVEGQPLKKAEQLLSRMADGKMLHLDVERGSRAHAVAVVPEQQGNIYRMGAYVRDHVAGIGTVSFYDPEKGTFGALGHGINDPGSELPLEIDAGLVIPSSVCGVVRGVSGAAGQLKGEFDVQHIMGTVSSNTKSGVFGTLTPPPWKPVPVACSREIRCGAAEILSNVKDRQVQRYSIEILKCMDEKTAQGKDMLIRVTDPELLRSTGGIVQGMSGSPILQDGKLVGAVTHVLVNSPDTGYGIFIENMLEEAG